MLTAEGCLNRRRRLRAALTDEFLSTTVLLGDPLHLRYFANFHVEPISHHADFGGLLAIRPDASAELLCDNRLEAFAAKAHVEKVRLIPWYDGQSPGQGPRRTVLLDALRSLGGRVHDLLGDPAAEAIQQATAVLRRAKDSDELALLVECMRVGAIGQEWARYNLRAGLTELEVYLGIANACSLSVDRAVILYGDFTVSPGSTKRGGPPTTHVLQNGETLILDFSVVIDGYRSDFTNTLVVGGEPTSEQRRLMALATTALAAGEAELRAGALCQTVYDAVRKVFDDAGTAEAFPHHAGHGLGLSHPEAPFFVRRSTETLLAGDVVTLEPGLYIDGVGGVRVEHNYLITATGFERLSNHRLGF